MMGPAPSDSGLQPERTGLAWRRTTITLVATALLTLRLRSPALGPWGVGVGLLVLLASGSLWVLGERRFRRVRRALVTSSGLVPDGGLLLAAAVIVATAAALGLASLLLTH